MDSIISSNKEYEEERTRTSTNSPLVPMESKYPWLMISHKKDENKQTFYNVSLNRHYTINFPEMCGMRVRLCTSHGWWVLEDMYSNDYFLLNPRSMQKIKLPSLYNYDDPDECCYYGICLMTAALNEPNCFVIFGSDNFLMIYEPGRDDKFVKRYVQLEEEGSSLADALVFKGKIYLLINVERSIYSLATLDLSTCSEKGSSIIQLTKLSMEEELSWPSPPHTGAFRTNLIESNGQLMLLHTIYGDAFEMSQVLDHRLFQLVHVSDDDDDACDAITSWKEVDFMGYETTIFVAPQYGISCCAASTQGESMVKGNSIYFTREHLSRNLFIFDFENRSITRTLPTPTIPRSGSMSWVMI